MKTNKELIKVIIEIGYEIEMKTKDEHYPIDYEEILEKLHRLEKDLST